ncbi:hypothetical protein GDO86_017458 [Hymenochirus boettgeri]|uniref:Uncharacterized protein n=1 Tax=Hymenochirus boettgeri TaxID=247094 RepID=A0A8T2INK3_9PIPI|nr:hypothetical protein GDO86_017458 [Hymenochirus boettgeri]
MLHSICHPISSVPAVKQPPWHSNLHLSREFTLLSLRTDRFLMERCPAILPVMSSVDQCCVCLLRENKAAQLICVPNQGSQEILNG